MTVRTVAGMGGVVWRDVALGLEPRALARPARFRTTSSTAIRQESDVHEVATHRGADEPSHIEQSAYDAAFQQGFRDGHAKGRQEGFEKGEAAAAQQARGVLDTAIAQALKPLEEKAHKLQVLADALSGGVAKSLEAAQDEMALLAFEVVCRIVGGGAVTPAGVRALVDQAVKAWRGRQPLAVHLHPADLALLRGCEAPSQPLQAEYGGQVRWIADESVGMGGCVLRSAEGGLDARLEAQLGAFKELLLQSRGAGALLGESAGGAGS